MKLPFQEMTNRQLSEMLDAKRKKGILEAWPIVGEMARRMRRVQELLRASEDYGMDGPETKELINEIVQTFRTYKLNGAGDKCC